MLDIPDFAVVAERRELDRISHLPRPRIAGWRRRYRRTNWWFASWRLVLIGLHFSKRWNLH